MDANQELWLGLLAGFVLLPATCVLLERLWPALRQPVLRPGFWADAMWYFTQAVVQRIIAPWVVFLLLILPFYLAADLPFRGYWDGFGPLSELAIGWQMLIVFFAYDFCSYWQHRWFHKRRLWPIHAVHHSSTQVDWLSSARFHPLNEIGVQIVCVTPIMLAGISPMALVLIAPFSGAYAVYLHCNLNWDYGPLRSVIASPVFHRWHHTLQAEGRDKNFAGALPLWDILFGTYYMPNRRPEQFGTSDPVPAGYLRQMAYPFATRRAQSLNQVMAKSAKSA